jgi:hypothetical protein
MTLFNSTKNETINDFITLLNNGQVKMSFNVTRRSVDSPYYGKILINGIKDDNYNTVVKFIKFMGLTDVLRKESKNSWKKLIYSNELLESLYTMDVFNQMINKTMETNDKLKTLVQTITVKHQEQPLMEVCEDLPF